MSNQPIGSVADNPYQCVKVNDGCQTNVYAKSKIGHVKYKFTWETFDGYNFGVYNGILDLDPFASLEEVTKSLLESLHYDAYT